MSKAQETVTPSLEKKREEDCGSNWYFNALVIYLPLNMTKLMSFLEREQRKAKGKKGGNVCGSICGIKF